MPFRITGISLPLHFNKLRSKRIHILFGSNIKTSYTLLVIIENTKYKLIKNIIFLIELIYTQDKEVNILFQGIETNRFQAVKAIVYLLWIA